MTYVDCVNVSPKYITLKVGTWFYGASAQTCPCDANCNCVTWSSNNTSVATVNETSGYIYAKSVGTAIICAMANDGSGKCGYMTVVVKDKVMVESINLNWSNITVEKNREIALEADILPEEADNKNIVWSSDNPGVAEVSCDGVVTTKSGGLAIITAASVDGSNVKGKCSVVVTDNKLVHEIKITPGTLRMALSQTVHLSEDVYPEDATIKSVNWRSSDESIASVNPITGFVIPHNVGTVTITATANDNSGVYSTCNVEIYAIPINSIEMFTKTKTMKPGEETVFATKICPVNANYKSLRWESSNPRVAEVDFMTGKVTALKDGTATITAKDMSSDVTATATVTVDSRNKAIVKKDGEFLTIEFEDGRTWKSIESDLSLSNNRSNFDIWNSDYYNYLNEPEQRYLYNVDQEFSDEEIAYIYLFDPLGVEYYVKTNSVDKYMGDTTGQLLYKDRIYKAIFGEPIRGKFYFRMVDGKPVYSTYDNYSRYEVYSNAEILFGTHVIYDLKGMLTDLLISIFENIPVISTIQTGVEMYQTMFHSSSILGVCNNEVKSYIEEYSSKVVESVYGKSGKMIFWCWNMLKTIEDNILEIPNSNDTKIYEKIKESKYYRTVFKNFDEEMSMDDIIEKFNNP